MPSLQRIRGPIAYELHRRRRRTLVITVRDDGGVEVRAPQRATRREIDAFVAGHAAWIREKQRENRARRARLRARAFDDGDELPYLGSTLRLVVTESRNAAMAAPRRRGDDLVVEVPADLGTRTRRTLTRYAVGTWLLEEARVVFRRRLAAASRRVGDRAECVTIKDMHTRWGSCGPSRRMSLNWRLIMAPPRVIDYVIVHELCHVRSPDHSPRFWRRVAAFCPHWEESRDWLDAHGADLEL